MAKPKLSRKERKARTAIRIRELIFEATKQVLDIPRYQKAMKKFIVYKDRDALGMIYNEMLQVLARQGTLIPHEQTLYMKAIREAPPIFTDSIVELVKAFKEKI